MYSVGQTVNVERVAIYADNAPGSKLQESTKTIIKVHPDPTVRAVKFKGSKLWFSVSHDGQWFRAKRVQYRIA
ncbi:MAG: hypothetical protein ACYSW0_18430 [Planctomycetota bacterium]|jgi:hypothetical protein